jgi:hypothetical protein
MKAIILLLCLISSVLYGQEFNKIEDSLIVYNLRLSSACDSSDLELKKINEIPQSYDDLSNNNYCYSINPASNTISISFSFISDVDGLVYINSGYSILNCTSTTFSSVLLYDNTICELVGEGFLFQIISGHLYTWTIVATTSGIFCDGFSTICPYWLNVTPLAIDLKLFEAIVYNKSVYLNWSTFSETNSHYFIIYKSDGFSEFKEIGKVYSSGYSVFEKNYQFIDNKPFPGNSYYKLTEVDLNGYSKDYSTISVYNPEQMSYEVYDEFGRKTDLTKKGFKIIRYENGSVTYKFIYN